MHTDVTHPTSDVADRRRRGLFILGAGSVGYALFGMATNLWIPCPFLTVTGHFCPSCGVTRMVLAILRGDLATAYQKNRLLFILSPYFLVLFIRYVIHTLKGRPLTIKRGEHFFMILLCVALILFGILRNTPMFAHWAP